MCREPNVPTSTAVRNMFLICEGATLNSEAICLNLSAPGSGALAYVNPRGAGRSLPVLERLTRYRLGPDGPLPLHAPDSPVVRAAR